MAKNKKTSKKSGKKAFTFSYDAPVTLSFFILSATAFLLDVFVFKGKLSENLRCLGSWEGHTFNADNVMDYVRIIGHVFVSSTWTVFLAESVLILLIGPVLEERYGSPVVALMLFVTVLVAGVLGQTVSPYPFSGSTSLIFMMILLFSLMAFFRREIKLSYVLVFVLYTVYVLYSSCQANAADKSFMSFLQSNIPTFISLAAGLCGSLFGFLASPKKSRARSFSSDTTVSAESLNSDDSYSLSSGKSSEKEKKHGKREKYSKSSEKETVVAAQPAAEDPVDGETIIGSMEF